MSSLLGEIAVGLLLHPPEKDDKYAQKSVQLVRGSSFRSDFLQNPHFKKLSPKLMDLIMCQYLPMKDLSIRMVGEFARNYESYYGLESCLENTLRNIMSLQPTFFFPRNYVPLMMVQLGRDDDAYNFIKFWLKNTPVEEVEGTFNYKIF